MTATTPDPTVTTATAEFPDRDLDPHFAEEARRMAAELVEAQVPSRYADAVTDVPAITDWIRELIRRSVAGSRSPVPSVRRGPSLLLMGNTGTGKTHQCYGAMRALSVSGVRCRWRLMTAADIYARLRPRTGVDSEREFEGIADTPLLVIDDLGAAKASEWTEEVNYRLINHRYEREMPTLMTSNVTPSQLREAVGERVASRLVEMADRVPMGGDDRRRPKKTSIPN